MSGGNHLHSRNALLKPSDHKMKRTTVVDLATFTKFVRIHQLATRVLRNELRIALHVADLTVTYRGQGALRGYLIGAELHAGGARVENYDGLTHAKSSSIYSLARFLRQLGAANRNSRLQKGL